MLENGTVLTFTGEKVALSSQQGSDSATFTIAKEDHTLGNSLRFAILKNPHVLFAAYSLPHPSEERLNLRIQTDGSITPIDAFKLGLEDLIAMFQEIHDVFDSKLTEANTN